MAFEGRKHYEVEFSDEDEAGEIEYALRDGWGHCLDTEVNGNKLSFAFDHGVERSFPSAVHIVLEQWFNGRAVPVGA